MSQAATPIQWTLSDLEGLPDTGSRYEIVAGELIVTRAPHLDHQDVIGLIYARLLAWSLENGSGKPYLTPGLIFSQTDAVIPDLIWISHQRRQQILDDAGHLNGPPELVIEVLSRSESDRRRDRQTKLKLYSVQGVSEYWIVDHQQQQIEIYQRSQGALEKSRTLFPSDRISSSLLPGFAGEISTWM